MDAPLLVFTIYYFQNLKTLSSLSRMVSSLIVGRPRCLDPAGQGKHFKTRAAGVRAGSGEPCDGGGATEPRLRIKSPWRRGCGHL